MVFATCPSKEKKGSCGINIVYNKQTSFCGHGDDLDCRPISQLCKGDPEFKFEFDQEDVNIQSNILGSYFPRHQ